ncbi:alkene reductase [Streptomyces sp. ODS05-4]|uniref:alkene reductase n=1 Tax=Streptomyces sp. ODS05-4 TaxID=2944939 RepID=UPI00210C3905|nr:alkene reductase [Streptomyces sp. ODS05-4]
MPTAFEPLIIGATSAANRLFMAPMTRNRATPDGGLPTALMARYYAQRAGAGLIVSEGIWPSPVGQGYIATPGLHDPGQTAAWRTVTDAVHAAGGKIFAQLMHAGRIGHVNLTGLTPVAPSAVRAPGVTYTAGGAEENGVPRPLDEAEILGTVVDHAEAARRAVEAGFDGVEIHAANGYLLHQFLSENVNLRTDRWGGSVDHRIRLTVEVVRAAAEAIGADRVALRISPGNTDQDIVESDPEELYAALLTELSDLPLAYVHTRETTGRELTRKIRAAWAGPLVLNPAYDEGRPPHEVVDEILAEGVADAVALARPFLAHPDLPARLADQGPYNTADPATFYTGGATGYIDYPTQTA